jgi:methylmalonyl-CoA/ethylmalonyl-CoA epimerase
VAVERHGDAWPRYAGDLAGEWLSGGRAPGFAPAQLRYGNGMKVEVLEPNAIELNDFLRRFLDRRGPGAHHLTFKVPDIGATLALARELGFEPVGVDLRDPTWKEAFVHPKEAYGITVQIAEAIGDWWSPAPPDWPAPRAAPADLELIVLQVDDLDGARRLYQELVGGEPIADDPARGTVDLAWPGPGRLRLAAVAPGVLPANDRGRIEHVVFAVDEPSAIGDAVPGEDGTWTVPARANHGVPLLLVPRAG